MSLLSVLTVARECWSAIAFDFCLFLAQALPNFFRVLVLCGGIFRIRFCFYTAGVQAVQFSDGLQSFAGSDKLPLQAPAFFSASPRVFCGGGSRVQ